MVVVLFGGGGVEVVCGVVLVNFVVVDIGVMVESGEIAVWSFPLFTLPPPSLLLLFLFNPPSLLLLLFLFNPPSRSFFLLPSHHFQTLPPFHNPPSTLFLLHLTNLPLNSIPSFLHLLQTTHVHTDKTGPWCQQRQRIGNRAAKQPW